MSTSGTTAGARGEPELMAEAGVWLARLHGPNRTREAEEGFQAWLKESPRHAAAFEHMTDTWEKAARLRRRPREEAARWEFPGLRISFSNAVAVVASVAIIAVLTTVWFLRDEAVTTSVGEQRILTLDDGSRVFMNTATQAQVHYDDKVRRIELKQGEALFEVSQHPSWPFIVQAGDREIRALGTSFVVRRDPQDLTVTLVEGKVVISPSMGASSPLSPAQSERPIALSPGERVTLGSDREVRVDRPAIDKLTAWQRGQIVLDDVPLTEAIAEMNRYSRVQLAVESAHAGEIHVSGIFRSGDVANFAQAVSRSYDLGLLNERRRIVLTDAPSHEASRP